MTSPVVRIGALFILCLALGATAAVGAAAPPSGALSCATSQQPKMVAELLFGRNIGDRGRVSAPAWARFVAREIAPRFPDGLTITDAIGRWRDRQNGRPVREASKRVEIVLPGHGDDEMRLEAIVAAYKRRFRQQSVGVIVWPACVAF